MITLPDKHFFVLIGSILGAVLFIGASVSWFREHDARILAEQTVKESQTRVVALEIQLQDIERAGKAQIADLRKRAKAVKTPEQAIAAIPEVSTLPLGVRPLPDAPSAVQVEALPLFQELSLCKQTAVGLGTCEAKAKLTEQIIGEKDAQIAALKHPKGFWKRFGTTLKDVGIGVAIGYTLNRATRR